ncbi:uncharacterized protein G2W53_017620 [Senna tora]|uniref:RNase H type-1 domain-containing protein n=1 Tax=Senna tora TaxID=362788 RepID=A0A834TTF7_9FABA|nr:uncharacterized protein G2W53_017620 [Senna tora]
MSHPCSAILSRIHHWFSYDWEVKVLHIHREGNYATNAMAGKAFSCSTELVIFQDAPGFLFQLLLSDLEGKSSYQQCAAIGDGTCNPNVGARPKSKVPRPRQICFSFAAYVKSLIKSLRWSNIAVAEGLLDLEISSRELSFNFCLLPNL